MEFNKSVATEISGSTTIAPKEHDASKAVLGHKWRENSTKELELCKDSKERKHDCWRVKTDKRFMIAWRLIHYTDLI